MDEQAREAVVSIYDERAELFKNKDFEIVDGERRIPEKKSAHFFVKRKVEYAMSMSAARRDQQVLEVGCSLGQMTVLLATRFDKVKAIDLSPKCVDLNTEKFTRAGMTNVVFATDDAEKLTTVEDGRMDLAYSFSAIRYCSDVQKAIDATYAKLKSGGTAVIDFPNKFSPWHLLVKKSIGLEKHVNDHLFGRKQLQGMFEQAGYTNIRMRNILFIPRALPSRWFPIFKLLNNLLEHVPLVNRLSGVIMVKGYKHESRKNDMGAGSI